MLKSLYEIGKLDLEKNDYNPIKKYLMSKTIKPVKNNHDKDKVYYEVIMNLEEKKKRVNIKLGKELSKENREKFYAFKSSPRGKRIFFSTNNIYYFIKIIPDIIDYYKKEKKNLNIEDNKKMNEFIDYLNELKKVFYDENSILESKRFEKNQRDYINKELNSMNNKKSYKKNFRKALENLINDKILGDIKLNDVSIVTMKLNNKRIDETRYANEYHNILEYNKFYRYLEKEKYKNKVCGCCGKNKDITAKLDFPKLLKLYITTGKNFFYGRSDNKSHRYKHFSLCEDCLINTYLGGNKIINNWRFNFLGDYDLRYFLIPKNIKGNKNFESKLEFLGQGLEENKGAENQIENLAFLKEDALESDLLLDFLFFTPNAQGTGISLEQTFSNISYNRIVNLFSSIYKINEKHFEIGKRSNRKISLNFPYYNIFRNKEGRNYKINKKEVLSFYKSLFNEGTISYRFILQRFLRMFKWKIKDKKTRDNAIWDVYNMQLFLTWISRVCSLKGGFELDSKEVYFNIEYPKINKYFMIHKKTYNNEDRQGLFFLGLLINEILRQQSDKNSNFLKKIKYEGMKKRDVKKLVSQVTESLNIYRPTINGNRVSLFRLNRKIYGLMMDRLQDLDNSELTRDENLFYILSGISFAKNVNYKKIKEEIDD